MHQAILLLGSNMGERALLLNQAIQKIEEKAGAIEKTSCIYESEPWGFETEDTFLNQVVQIRTTMQPEALLEMVLYIEDILGRKREGSAYQSRLIDIDILFYDDIIMHSRKLKIPHPSLHKRMFTLLPLNEIATGFIHPIFNDSVSNLMKKCSDKLWVKKL